MGRKAISDGRKFDQLRIMLTSAERAELDTAAKSIDQKTSTWARDLLLTAARAMAFETAAVPVKKPAKKTRPTTKD